MAKIGDYVTACLVEKTYTEDYPHGFDDPRQGVFVKDNGDGTIELQGEFGCRYHCFGPEGIDVVPDENLYPVTLQFVLKLRRKLGL